MVTGRRRREPAASSRPAQVPQPVPPGPAGAGAPAGGIVPKPAASRVVLKAARSAGYRHRRQLRPIWGALAAWVTGASAHLAHAGVPVTITVAVIAAICFLADLRRNKRRPGLRFYLAVVDLAAVWLVSAAAIAGPGSRAEGLAIFGTILAAFPYWWRHRQLFSVPGPEEAPVEDSRRALDFAAEIDAAWKQYVAPADGPLPGSVPAEWQRITSGIMSDVHLRRGKGTATKAIGKLEDVASALGEAPHDIVMERLPSLLAHMVRVTVFDQDNPLHVPQRWPGYSLDTDTGELQIGPYATGGTAPFRAWAPQGDGHAGGALHSLLCGTTRSGKSQFMLQLAIEYLRSGVVVLWAADQQFGMSMPEILAVARRAARTPAETIEMLRAAERILEARSRWMAANGIKVIIPTADTPMLRIMVDEAHLLLTDEATKKEAKRALEHLTQMGGKVAIGVDVVTQVPDLDQLGGSEVLRAMLQAGNIVCFRTSGKMTGDRAFQGTLAVDPSLIPRVYPGGYGSAGTCYIASAVAREAPARTWLMAVTDEEAAELAREAAKFQAVMDAVSAKAERGGDGSAAGTVVPAGPGPDAPPASAAAPVPGTRPVVFGPEDVVLETLRRAGRPLMPVQVWDNSGWAVKEWGLAKQYSSRSVGDALSGLLRSGRVCQDEKRGPYYLPEPAETAAEPEGVNA